jgi:hypothetical protein
VLLLAFAAPFQAMAVSPSMVTLQVSVVGRNMELVDLSVWMQPERGPGSKLAGYLELFTLPLPAQEVVLLRFECPTCITEEVLVDTHLPTRANGLRFFPVNVVLESKQLGSFAYLLPTGTIRYRKEIGGLGHVDPATFPTPTVLVQRMQELMATDQRTRTVSFRSADETPLRNERTGRIWLNEQLVECERVGASYFLEAGKKEGGQYIGYVRSKEGALRAIGHYMEIDLRTPHGNFTYYYPDGSIESAGRYCAGVKCGVWQRFDPRGGMLSERVYDPSVGAEFLTAGPNSGSAGMAALATPPRNLAIMRSRRPMYYHRVFQEEKSGMETDHASTVTTRPIKASAEEGDRARVTTEHLRVTTIRQVMEQDVPAEYRRVVTYYGAVHFFKNGRSCSALEYEQGIASGR